MILEQYCIYLRKSRADIELEAKGEMETLARHRKALLEVAQRQNLNVVRIYEEIVSGETIDARPIVRQLLDEVEQGLWTGVLVMEIERLARGDTIDQGIVARAFRMGHAKIITPTKTYDPDNEFDEEYFEFGLFMSRREYKTINRRIQRGRVASAKEGKFLGSVPPYGYEKVRIKGDKGYTLAPNEHESEIVRLIFSWYIGGESMTHIANRLDAMGVKPRKRESWSRSTINDILDNPVYTGKLRWAYRQEKKIIREGQIKKIRKVNDRPILVKGLHPAIISEEEYKAAQQIRAKNTKKTTRQSFSLKNPLSGLVYCAKCGSMMTRIGANKRTPYDFLHCTNRHCDNISAPLFLVENKIVENLRDFLLPYVVAIHKKEKSRNRAAYEKVLKEMKKELEKINIQINNTYTLLEQGVYTVEVFTRRNQLLSNSRQQILRSMEELEKQMEAENSQNAQPEQVPRLIGLLEGYPFAEKVEEKNAILQELLEKVEYKKDVPNPRGKGMNTNFEIKLFPKLTNL